MSLDQRCQQFHEAALGTGKSKGPIKEIATLRKFLYKNQDQRFTDKAISRIFDTIQIYCVTTKSNNNNNNENENEIEIDISIKEGLLEDSLKMPFTLFSTKQKKTMIKWLEDIRGTNNNTNNSGTTTTTTKQNTMILSVIDLNETNSCVSLMQDDTGDTYDDITLPEGTLGNKIKELFQTSDDTISVQVEMDDQNEDTVKQILSIE